MSCDNQEKIRIIVNEGICRVQDCYESDIDDVKRWINEIVNQEDSQKQTKANYCQVCDFKDHSINLENHHIAGRKHYPIQITVCKHCHRWLSDSQKTWDRRWCDENNSESLRLSFLLLGLSDILSLRWRKTNNYFFEFLASSLIEYISELLKQG